MRSKTAVQKPKRDLRAGRRASTASDALSHAEIEPVQRGRHGARTAQQAMGMGLSKARRTRTAMPLAKAGAAKAGAAKSRGRKPAASARPVGEGKRRGAAPAARGGRMMHRGVEAQGSASTGASRRALSSPAKRVPAARRARGSRAAMS